MEILPELISALGASVAAIVGAFALRQARNTDKELKNGTSDKLDLIMERENGQDKRLERIESKQDRFSVKLSDHIDEAETRYREILDWRKGNAD